MDPKLMQTLYHTVQVYNILPLTSVCNVRCLFCSHHQNPTAVRAVGVPPLPLHIVEDLLDFLDGKRKIVIGESASLIMEGEPFTHPHFFTCLDLIRKRFPQSTIQLTTNGTYLERETVKKLVQYKPLEINLSLNMADQDERKALMKDQKSDVACKAPRLLNKYEITYHGSVVAMPHITGWSHLFNTIEVLHQNGAETIRVFKPGFTKYTDKSLRLPPEMFRELEEKIAEWRQYLGPITLEPVILRDRKAKVTGVITPSPAATAGIRAEDIIVSINGKEPFSRVEAFNSLKQKGNYNLVVERKNSKFNVNLTINQEKSGLVFDYDISQAQVENIKRSMQNFNTDTPLLLASQLGYNILQVSLSHIDNLQIVPVKNEFFGGNIRAAGLLVVEDMKKTYKNFVQNNPKPDLLLVPAIAFDHSERDLTGAGIWELEEIVECPVILA